MMFWGLVLKPNKKYSQIVTKSFHLSQAALDTTGNAEDSIQLTLTSDKRNYILCTLRKNKVEQVALDLNFAMGDEIAFSSQGNGSVHLSGYLVPETDESVLDQLADEETDEEISTKNIKNSSKAIESTKKNGAEDEDNENDDEDEDDTEDEGETDSDDDVSMNIEEDNENDDEDEDDTEDSDEEELDEPKAKQMKVEKVKQNGLANGKVQSKEKGQKSKKDKKSNQQSQDKPTKSGEKALQGGVKIEDIRQGNGPEAKPGKKIQVFYEGRLKSNNKVFDSVKQGAGFKFGLGRGEVIKGWDIGVVGMKVGGKRRITCPPNMAYGAKGSPPVIPPNSTLIFDIELKAIH